MMIMSVHWLPVVAASIVAMIIGALWYGLFFGKHFMCAVGMDTMNADQIAELKKTLGMVYIYQFLGTLAMVYVLAVFMKNMGMVSFNGGLMVASLVWIGFVVPIKLSDALWCNQKTLFWLGIGNMLVTLLAAGAILGIWR